MRFLLASLLGLYTLLLSQPAQAQLIRYEFEGSCVSSGLTCSDFGLQEGELVTGAYALDPVVSDRAFFRSGVPVVEFELNVGNLKIGIDDLGSRTYAHVYAKVGASAQQPDQQFDTSFQMIPKPLPGDPEGREVRLSRFELSFQEDWRVYDPASSPPGTESLGDSILLDGGWTLVDPLPPAGAFDDLKFIFNTTTFFDREQPSPTYTVSFWDPHRNETGDYFTMPHYEYGGDDIQWAESYDLIDRAPNGLVYVLGNNIGQPLIGEFDSVTGALAGGFDFFQYSDRPWGVQDWSFTEDNQVLLASSLTRSIVETGKIESRYVTRVRLSDNQDKVTGVIDFGFDSDFQTGMQERIVNVQNVLDAGEGVAYVSFWDSQDAITRIVAIDLEASFQAGSPVILDTLLEVGASVRGMWQGPSGQIYVDLQESREARDLVLLDPTTGVLTPFIEGGGRIQFVGDRLFVQRGLTLFEYDPVTGEPLWPVVRPASRALDGFVIVNTVPEPSTIVAALLGLIGVSLRRW